MNLFFCLGACVCERYSDLYSLAFHKGTQLGCISFKSSSAFKPKKSTQQFLPLKRLTFFAHICSVDQYVIEWRQLWVNIFFWLNGALKMLLVANEVARPFRLLTAAWKEDWGEISQKRLMSKIREEKRIFFVIFIFVTYDLFNLQ